MQKEIKMELIPEDLDTKFCLEHLENIISSKQPPTSMKKISLLSLQKFLGSSSSKKRKIAACLILYFSSLSLENLEVLKKTHFLVEHNGYIGVSLETKQTLIDPDFFIETLKHDPKFMKEDLRSNRFFYKFMAKNCFENRFGKKIQILTLTEIQHFFKANLYKNIPDPLFNILWYFNKEYAEGIQNLNSHKILSSKTPRRRNLKFFSVQEVNKNQKFTIKKYSKSVVVKRKKFSKNIVVKRKKSLKRISKERKKKPYLDTTIANSLFSGSNSPPKTDDGKERYFRKKSNQRSHTGDFLIYRQKRRFIKNQSKVKPLFKPRRFKNKISNKNSLFYSPKKHSLNYDEDKCGFRKNSFTISVKGKKSSNLRKKVMKDFFKRKRRAKIPGFLFKDNLSVNNN